MKIGILVTGITPDTLIDQYGSYADMFIRLFQPHNPGFDYVIYNVSLGEFPASANDCDGWVITGSKHSVYEQLDWITQLKELVRQIATSKRPLVGICFGHQLIAEALGGKVEKYSGGWGLGINTYQLDNGFAQQLEQATGQAPPTLNINAVHQDQVSILPEGATVLAHSDFCRYAALSYCDNRIVSLQPHPEFTLDFEDALLDERGGEGIPLQDAQQGLASVRQPGACLDSPVIAGWLVAVLQQKQ
ncbi:gamma-glutamyl-gamma-aminobutyrate hydrolase family protein [Candidatus Thalassolituus haligoni]|uniref:glutamine amidotransferase-related protein n=1 Tax=Candidatus Thalassolituus haligoni TaxID=3100113 RepID=UPI00351773BF|tara:strand:- start:50 stop:787 length:738 start_codon:yes stop_codon:yes gene_type:complete